MRERKREFGTYLIFDYRGVEEHLSKMAAKGWRLEKIGPWFWTYRRAEPARTVYAVTYLAGASQFDPESSGTQAALEDLCASAGWEKAADWAQMQIFLNERPDPLPLETDESVRLEAIRRSMRKGFLPWGIALLLLALFFAGLQIKTLLTDPFHLLSSNSGLFTALMWDLLVILQAGNLFSYRRWYRRSLRSVARGGPCAETGPGLRRFNQAVLCLVLLLAAGYLAVLLLSADTWTAAYLFLYLAAVCLLVFVVDRVRRKLRKAGLSRRSNLFLTLAADVVLAFVLVGGITVVFLRSGVLSGGGETYLYQRQEWDVEPQALPLTIEDLTGQHYEHVRRYSYNGGSVLIRERSCREAVLDGEDLLVLDYDITALALPGLYHMTLAHCQAEWTDSGYYAWTEADPVPWGAEAAYQLRWGSGRFWYARPNYILCWQDRIVQLNLPELDPTPGQMSIIGEKLQNA